MMHKAKSGNKNNSISHLRLVNSKPATSIAEQPIPSESLPIDSKQIHYLTQSMMNRLWIPTTSTIVGLLNVGTTQDNFQELSKWISNQLNTPESDSASNDLPQLERRFLNVISHYTVM
jgi:hypothetical protein